ncbi:hypothetical protein BC939DRAFT_475381 [Gamsiella multidivaricata]|uniref:uncharacterized protein n=1 Tax=Gamsiella multidivaricata TaxID=101098 RepID=UPI00221FAA85|nr:uncharacterized protein BC939DRAFT_475381 [Gamsiella multidivaricata]KAI7827506.1 hypothetical protein BC939DRAFT_475381 [Gamsiella multidivaricata]
MAAVASLNICLIIMEAVSTILVFKGQEKASDNGAATADNKKSITDYVKDGGRDCGPISMGAATTVNQRQLSVETGVVQPLGLNGAVVYDMEQYHKEYQLYLKSQQLSTSDQATGAEASEGMEGKYDDPLQESSYKIEAPMDGPHEGSSSAVPPRPTIEGHFPHTPSIPPHLEVEPFTPSMKGHTQPPAIPLSGSSDLVHPILAIPAQQTSPTPSIDVRGLLPVDVQLRANP